MQVILDSIIFFILYFLLQIFLYRFVKININKISFIIAIFCISTIIAFYLQSLEALMYLININLMIGCFFIIMTGVTNHSPSLAIIDLIVNKKIYKKKKMKNFFLKKTAKNAVEKRLKINISSKFLKVKNRKIYIKKNFEDIIIFFNLIKKFYRLKTDV
jgi:hypothetical protein